MIALGPQYAKLKKNLKLAITRLNIIQAKKYELSQKVRREIAINIKDGKILKAKIKTQCMIREDNFLEAMDYAEIFCRQLLDRYSLFESKKTVDESLEEAVSSLIWIASYMQKEIGELKEIRQQLTRKYGRTYARVSSKNDKMTVNSDLVNRIRCLKPSEELVEKYMVEIAKSHNVEYDSKTTEEKTSSDNSNSVDDSKIGNNKRSPKLGWITNECEVSESCETSSEGPNLSRKAFDSLDVKRQPKPSKRSWLKGRKDSVHLISDVTENGTIENYFEKPALYFDEEDEVDDKDFTRQDATDCTPNDTNCSPNATDCSPNATDCTPHAAEFSNESLSTEVDAGEYNKFENGAKMSCKPLEDPSLITNRNIEPLSDEDMNDREKKQDENTNEIQSEFQDLPLDELNATNDTEHSGVNPEESELFYSTVSRHDLLQNGSNLSASLEVLPSYPSELSVHCAEEKVSEKSAFGDKGALTNISSMADVCNGAKHLEVYPEDLPPSYSTILRADDLRIFSKTDKNGCVHLAVLPSCPSKLSKSRAKDLGIKDSEDGKVKSGDDKKIERGIISSNNMGYAEEADNSCVDVHNESFKHNVSCKVIHKQSTSPKSHSKTTELYIGDDCDWSVDIEDLNERLRRLKEE